MMDFALAAEPLEVFVGSIQLLLKGPWPEVQKIHQKHPRSSQEVGRKRACQADLQLAMWGVTATKR